MHYCLIIHGLVSSTVCWLTQCLSFSPGPTSVLECYVINLIWQFQFFPWLDLRFEQPWLVCLILFIYVVNYIDTYIQQLNGHVQLNGCLCPTFHLYLDSQFRNGYQITWKSNNRTWRINCIIYLNITRVEVIYTNSVQFWCTVCAQWSTYCLCKSSIINKTSIFAAYSVFFHF